MPGFKARAGRVRSCLASLREQLTGGKERPLLAPL